MNKLKGESVNIVLNISECRGFERVKKTRVAGKFKAQLLKSELKTSSAHSAKTEMVWKVEKAEAKKARGEYANVRIDIYTAENTFFGYAMISLRTAKIMNSGDSLSYRWIRLSSVPAAFKQGNPQLNIALSIQECKTFDAPQLISQQNAVPQPTDILELTAEPQMISLAAEVANEVGLTKVIKKQNKVPLKFTELTPSQLVNTKGQHVVCSPEDAKQYTKSILILGDADVISVKEQQAEDEKRPILQKASSVAIILEEVEPEETSAVKIEDPIPIPIPIDSCYTQLIVTISVTSLCWMEAVPAEYILIIFNHPLVKTQLKYKVPTDLGCDYKYIPFDNVVCSMVYLTLKGDERQILNKYPPSIEISNADTKETLSRRIILDEPTVHRTIRNFFLFKRLDNNGPLCTCKIEISVLVLPPGTPLQTSDTDLKPLVITDSCLMHKMQEFEEWLFLRNTGCREDWLSIESIVGVRQDATALNNCAHENEKDEDSDYLDCPQDVAKATISPATTTD